MLDELAVIDLRGVTWARAKRAARAVANDFTEYDLLTYSSAIAFQVLYAVVPMVMLGLAGLGLFHVPSLYTHHVEPTLRHSLSHDAFGIANRTAMKAIGPEKWWWATIGLGVTLWGVGAALRSMMTPLNQIYGTDEHRSWLRRLLTSIGGGAIVILCLYGAIVVVLVGRLVPAGQLSVLVFVVRWLLALLFLFTSIAVLIRFVPAKKRPIEWVSVGSALSVVCWLVATIGFDAYISTVSYSSFYGAFAAIVLLLIYLHVSAIAFLLGVTVDAQLRERVKRSR